MNLNNGGHMIEVNNISKEFQKEIGKGKKQRFYADEDI